MGFDPGEIRHIAYAGEKNIGISDIKRIDVVGENVDAAKHMFQRPSIEGRVFNFKDISVVAGKGCSGCREACFIGLSAMTESELEKIGDATVVMGSDVDLSELKEDRRLFLVGNCTLKSEYKGQRIEGCPPPGLHVRKCLLDAY
jgi:hypothetical protein